MSSEHHIRVPCEWTVPHKKILAMEESEELIAFNELLLWVNETGLTTEEGARSVFKEINAYFYLRFLYPILPDDPSSIKIFQLNVRFLVLGYIVDDSIEKYNESKMKELISGYNLLQNQLSTTFPKYPCISEMKQLLSNMQNNFSKSIVATLVDYVNKTASILHEGGELAEDKVINYRKRLSNVFAVYLDALLSKTKFGCEISVSEMLWRRCMDGNAITLHMSIEVFSRTLVKNHVLPVSESYKLYLLSALFAAVINDLYSYERDKLDNSDNIIKVLLNENSVRDMAAATLKISKILDAVIQQIYLFVQEGKTNYPAMSEWFQYVGLATVGWIYIHKDIVQRYVSSPFQITPVEIQDSMISDWLLNKDVYGQNIVQQFIENIDDPSRKTTMDLLHGSLICNVLDPS